MPCVIWNSSGIIGLMFQLHMVAWFACKQHSREGQEAKRMRLRKKKAERKSLGLPFRHPNKSELFCCCLCSAYAKQGCLGNQKQRLQPSQSPAGMQRQEFSCWATVDGRGSCFVLFEAVTLDTGDWEYCCVQTLHGALGLDMPQVERWGAAGCGPVRGTEFPR